jgi:hypothetical protein
MAAVVGQPGQVVRTLATVFLSGSASHNSPRLLATTNAPGTLQV